MDLDGLTFFKLQSDTLIKPFKSKDNDLNDFLFSKAKEYHNELLATTFLIENDVKTFAFVSVFNDCLKIEEFNFASKSAVKRFMKNLVSHPKRHLESFPAIKIGRLAVCEQERGFGTLLIQYIIEYAIRCNDDCGCKLITVDAYSDSTGFYEKKGFAYLTENDAQEDTRQMFFDLTPYLNQKEEVIAV